MDQKSWPWKKRSVEKTLMSEKTNNSLSRNEEFPELLAEKAELQRDVRILNERLSAALSECNAKDSIAQKQAKIAQEAITGWEKAEEEAIYLKKELDKVLEQKAASEERLSQLDAALKECMQQLRFVREEQERRVHGAVVKITEEFEKTQIALEQKLAETNKRLTILDAENTVLRKALAGKDKVIEDLSKSRAKIEAEFNGLMGRVESMEKVNASLKYENRVLEKELEIRNEEREFNCRTAEVSQKQQLESNKRIVKLESECQRLRLLVRKRLPGPAALMKMKNEVEMLNKDPVEPRRRRSNSSPMSPMDSHYNPSPDTPSKRTDSLTDQLHVMEEENRSLKEILSKKSNEIQFSKTTYARAGSPLSRVQEPLKGQTNINPDGYRYFMRENSVTASSDVFSDDKASCAESWASALISELEHFKNEKQNTLSRRNMETPDMNLMDDFAEMEKLAVVSLDYPAASSHHSSDEGNANATIYSTSHGSELVPARNHSSEQLMSGEEILPNLCAANEVPGHLGLLMKMVLELSHVLQRNPNEVLEELKVALTNNGSNPPDFSGQGTINFDASGGQKFIPELQLDVATSSIQKILELVEGINITTQDGVPESGTGYVARVFQWKTVELSAILQQFIRTCNDLLNGKADLDVFCEQIAYNLDWIMNHCFSLQDVSSMKDAFRNNLDWDESISESEVESGSVNHSAESNRPCIIKVETTVIQPNLKDDHQFLKVDVAKKEFSVEDEPLGLNVEVLNQSKEKTVDQTEKQKMLKEDLVAQLMETNLKILQLENDLEKKNNSCRKLEETCNNLKIQLNRVSSKQDPADGKQWEKQLQDDWEITAASEKLAECQETILNLGKQLKALASPRDAALFDKVISAPAETSETSTGTLERNTSPRLSLLDKMIAEDNDKTRVVSGTKDDTENTNIDSAVSTPNVWAKFVSSNGTSHDADKISPTLMAIVPNKRSGSRSFLKKLFSRQRKVGSKKT